MLTLLQNPAVTEKSRLRVAISHLESAISHINNEAQCQVPRTQNSDSRDVEQLRLIVCALADVVGALRSMRDASRDESRS